MVEHGQEAQPDLGVGDEGGVGGGVLEEPLGGDHGHREALRVGVHHHETRGRPALVDAPGLKKLLGDPKKIGLRHKSGMDSRNLLKSILNSNTTYLRVECVEQHDQLLVDVLDGGDNDVIHIPRIISNGALPCVPQSGDEAR